MESRHIAKNINVSLRKVRTFIPAIKKMSPVDALIRLDLLPQSAAHALAQAIQTVIANAETSLKVSKDMLEFRKLYADQGLVLKRFRAGSRGTAKPITRRMTHITVVLGAKKINKSPAVDRVKIETTKKVETKSKKEVKIKPSKQKEKGVKSKKSSTKEN